MFQIFDCTGAPVGRAEGYKLHRTAESLINRPGRIRRAIWDRFHTTPATADGRRLVYAIRWVDPVAAAIVARTGISAGRLIVSHVRG